MESIQKTKKSASNKNAEATEIAINHLTAEDWEKYIFSDESSKYLFHVPNRQDDVV